LDYRHAIFDRFDARSNSITNMAENRQIGNRNKRPACKRLGDEIGRPEAFPRRGIGPVPATGTTFAFCPIVSERRVKVKKEHL